MKDSIKNRKNKLLALCLSAMMLSSVAALGACTDSSETDSSSTSSSSASTSAEKDTGLIKNAGFETYDAKNAINTSATGWSRSVNSATSGSALSSKAASGIIDLNEDAWNDLTGTNPNYDVTKLTEEEAEAAWDKLTTKDKLAYYDTWKDKNKDGTISKDLSFYESFNIDSGDIPDIARFDTHHKEGDEGYGEDTKVLMIHNEYPEKDSTATYKALGTAQKYTSSSTVTIKAGTSAEFSVWVRTQDLQSSSTSGDPQEAVDKGAYISITHSVGGKALDAFIVENINTENMAENELSNGWKQYTFLLKGSSYADTTFSVVLGLGQGGGTYRAEYVNGYAFFDDIQCNIIPNDDSNQSSEEAKKVGNFEDKLQALVDANKIDSALTDVIRFDTAAEKKEVNVAKYPEKDAFVFDFYGEPSSLTYDVLTGATGSATTSENNAEGTVSSLAGSNAASWLDGGFDGTNDVKTVFNNVEDMKNAVTANPDNKFLSSVYTEYFEKNNFAKDKQILLIMSAQGAAYTVNTANSFDFNGTDGYLRISFFVKTSDLNGYTGAGITLVDGNNKTSFTSIDTSAISPVEIGDNKDVYEGWQQCFFFVKNNTDNPSTSFSLSFNFGPTAIEESTSKDSYHPGFAAFTGFEIYKMTEEEYEAAQSGTYAKLVTVKGADKDDSATENGFDNVAGVPSNKIETGLANLQNYKGVYSNSAYITGGIDDSTEYNKHANAGLLSKEYFTTGDYFATSTDAWLTGLKAINPSATASALWSEVFGNDSTRPLLIWNDGSNDGKAYGYIGASTSVAANTYTAVSLRVKVSADAKASIYLIDTSKDNYDSTLSIGRNLTYWYDKDGNVCTGDPSKKATQVAFKLQTNGLYIANTTWDGYDASMAGKYYANLNAYEKDSLTGNLLIAEGGASHKYNDYWNNEGLDGIAYYYNKSNSTYYADRAMTVAVNNLADVTALEARLDSIDAADQPLMATVEDTKGQWKTVTFYIHTGDLAKNYRLEVWSGDRNGNAGDKGYVIFDTYNPGSADSNFTSLMDEYKENESAVQFNGVFSYFDTAMYLRYNASLDEIGDGNLYEENYTPTAQTEGIAYLLYDTDEEFTVFADYQYSEKAVTASTPDADEDDTDDSTSDTEAETNIWLLVSSLAIAVILVFVVISIIVRKIWAKVRKNRAAQASLKNNKK